MPVSSTSPIKILLDLGINLDNLSDDEDYLSALMEATNGLSITNPGDGRIKVLQNEIRRVRADRKNAAPSGGMKATKKRIGVASILGKGGIKATTKTVNTSKLLAGSPETKKGGATGGFGLSESLSKISESVTSIAKTLKEQQKQEKKESAFDRKAEENRKRGLAETNLEKGFKKVGAIAQKILKPVKSILDRIIQFFMAIVIGKILIKFLDWIADPANQEKIRSFTRFLVDHGPKLLVAFLLFGTTLGRMATRLVGIVIAGAIKLGAAITKLALAHPKAAAIVGIGALGAWGISKLRGDNPVNEDEPVQGMTGGSFVENYFGPGQIPGTGNKDTVPSMLTPGEFVMSKGAVQKYGVDTLEGMNAAGGGTNKPTLMPSNRFGFKGGGYTLSWPEARDKVMNVTNTMALEGRERLPWFDSAMRWGGGIGRQSGSSSNTGSSFGGVPSWEDVGGSVLRGMSGTFATLNLEGSKLYNSLIGGSKTKTDGGDILSSLSNQGAKLHGLVTRGKYGLKGGDKGSGMLSQLTGAAGSVKDWVGSKVGGLKDLRYPGENWAIERERKLGLMEPGADSLTKETREKLKTQDNYIRSLSGLRKEIENKGIIPDPFMLLKTEGAENLVENLSGGRIKNLGAKITGLQYAAKGLLGPLGRAYRIDDMGSLGRYLKPAMEEAQKQGHSSVGRKALGGETYDRLVGDKLANLALGQTQFRVGKDGRAVTDDTYDSNMTAEFYLKKSREALKSGDMGTALFNGLSGLLRVNQNTGWGNLRPGGLGIELGQGHRPTDPSGKVIPQAKISPQQKPTTTAPPPPSVDPESFANTGTGDDGTFGEGTYGQGRPGDSNVNNGAPNISLTGAANWIKGVIGLDG